jgi:hypothetical protein
MDGSKISCIGIIGDGCGGGREFSVQNNTLFAYDELTKDKIILLEGIKNARDINKSGCIITIKCEEEIIKFDLSTLTKKA